VAHDNARAGRYNILMRILTASQMQKVDEETIAHVVPGLELMERAGRAVARTLVTGFSQSGMPGPPRKAAIFVGPGNNGGDGLVIARHLLEAGWPCSVHLLKPSGELTPDTEKNYQRRIATKAAGLREFDATRPDYPQRAAEDLADAAIIVDTLFGTGISGAPRGRAAEMIVLMNQAGARNIPVVSVDIPSGIDGNTGAVPGAAVKAMQTVTIGTPKTGLLFYPGRALVGALGVVDIGFPDAIIEKHSEPLYLLDDAEAAVRTAPRAHDIHKYQAGTLLVIAGSDAYRGAPLLTAEAALRSGCGMVYLAVPECIRHDMTLREAITVSLPQTAAGTIAASTAAAVLKPYLDRADAVAIGPGLGRNDETDAFVREFVLTCGKPVVLDADGITAFAGNSADFAKTRTPIVLTPHDGEMQKLIDTRVPLKSLDRVKFAREQAAKLGVTLVLKGAPALVAARDGAVWVSGTGTSALATGGTGDVLTGMVGSFLAQAVGSIRRDAPDTPAALQPAQVADATAVACFLHGRAGELAARSRGVRGVIASDLLAALGPALVSLEQRLGR
jgi:NAD(P)H-hydrate epimerase